MFVQELWTGGLKLSILIVFIPSLLVIFNAVLSAKTLGGELGKGLKKIAAGTICYVMILLSVVTNEHGPAGILNDEQMKIYFMSGNVIGSILLMFGFLQIYRVSKKLKLF